MARSKDISRYPAEYLKMAEQFEKHHAEPLVITCKDYSEACKLRFRLYGFLKAMKLGDMWREYPIFYSAEFRCCMDGRIVIEARDQTREAQLVAAALKGTTAPTKKE